MILDLHCHYRPEFFRYREYRMDLDCLVDAMDRHQISRAALSPAGEFAAYSTSEGNRAVAAAVRRFPARFLAFATVNPWARASGIEEMRRVHGESGAAGLVLHPILQGFEADDPLVFPLVEAALALGMIVYVTGGAPYLAMPYKIADLAGRYPEGRFVMGHAGWDYHFDVPYCLEACPNLWAETSPSTESAPAASCSAPTSPSAARRRRNGTWSRSGPRSRMKPIAVQFSARTRLQGLHRH